jgi:hypothetical protein
MRHRSRTRRDRCDDKLQTGGSENSGRVKGALQAPEHVVVGVASSTQLRREIIDCQEPSLLATGGQPVMASEANGLVGDLDRVEAPRLRHFDD